MKTFRLILVIAVFTLAFAMPVSIMAQTTTKSGVSTDTTLSKNNETTYGEVRKIDKEDGKLTLRHGKIKNLDMPPMTMVFKVNDKGILDKIKVGDKVEFKATKDNGQLTITDIKIAK